MSVESTQKSPDPDGASSASDDLPVRAAGESAPLAPDTTPAEQLALRLASWPGRPGATSAWSSPCCWSASSG